MKLQLTESEQAFQKEVRNFIAENFTDELAAKIQDPNTYKEATVEWQKLLFDKGWIATSWPKEHGGTGWSVTEKFIFSNEIASAGAPDISPFGLKMVGPVIYTYGTEEQKEKFLPSILNSDTWWCQGYSEPGSGSDLSSLQTKAQREGDHYIINGSKIWTTYAQHADWIFCLVRSDNSGKPQQGISFLLIDMNTPGVTVRPIVTIDNAHHLNEVIFEDAKVPVENLIGEEGKGWTYAKFLLNNERNSVAGVAYCNSKLEEIKKLAAQLPNQDSVLLNNPSFQQRLMDVQVNLMSLEAMELRSLIRTKNKQDVASDPSMLKILGTELQQALHVLYLEVAGVYAGVVDSDIKDGFHDFGHYARKEYLYGRAATIYAGSNEIQRNIISKIKFGF